MDRIRFFELLESAREGVEADAPSADADDLRTALEALDDDELLAFARRFTQELALLDRRPVREAAFVVTGATGDDRFAAFRAWLIGKGSAAVDAVLADPEDLADLLTPGEEPANQALATAALEAVDERGLTDPQGEDSVATPDTEPDTGPFDPDAADARLPRLAAARRRTLG